MPTPYHPDVLVSDLPGVCRRDLRVFGDERGSFREVWRVSWERDGCPPAGHPPFVQANISHSDANVLRGLHFHRRQDDYWVLVSGRARVQLVDLRDATAATLDAGHRPPSMTFEMEPDGAVFIPRGIAHGFYALERLTLAYLVTSEYDGTDELGFAWNDPAVAIEWADEPPVLSQRDRSNPPLRELLLRLESEGNVRPGS